MSKSDTPPTTPKPDKPRRAATGARRGKATGKRKVLKRIGFGFLIFSLVLGLAGIGVFLYLYQTTKLPDPNGEFQTNTTFVTYAGGEPMSSLAIQNRETLSYEEIPQLAKDAVIAAENRSFWTDPGFDLKAITRAAWSIIRGRELQGGSTITQQYIKILYLNSERNVRRKVRELVLAIKMGKELRKEEILAGYLNTIYFGRGAYGIQAAAKSYFLKPASELSIAEMATLAAVLNNPAGFNPSGGEAKREKLFGRYKYVLDSMLEMGKITAQQHDEASKALPEFPEVPVNNRYGGPKGYLLKMVEQELEEIGIPEDQVQGGGLRITTTIEQPLQDHAVEVAQRYTAQAAEQGDSGAKPEDLHIAIASVDNATGAIKALYGGPDYVQLPRNWSTTPRPAASTFKTFAVIAALREDLGLNTKLNGDTFTPRGDSKPIHNQGQRNYGEVTLRQALANSMNTAFVDLSEKLKGGPQAIVQAANDAGAPEGPGWDRHNRLALGFGEVSPLDMANAYATLANDGKRNTAHIVAKVEDSHGAVLYEAEPEQEQTIDQEIAATVVDALTSVVDEGTGAQADKLDRPVAGKTGTNGVDDGITSAWFIGMTKQVSTAVMYVAGEGGNADLVPFRQPGDRTFYGSGYPLKTWLDYMTKAVAGQPVADFTKPKRQPEQEETASGRDEKVEVKPSPQPSPEPTSPTPVEPSPEPEPSPSDSGKKSNPERTEKPKPNRSTDPDPNSSETPDRPRSERPDPGESASESEPPPNDPPDNDAPGGQSADSSGTGAAED